MSTIDVRLKTAATLVEAGPAGTVSAVIATLGVKDHDGDVSYASTFTPGEEIILSSYNHASMQGVGLPVGKGNIRVAGSEVILDGRYFLQNRSAREAFEVVKEMGPSQQWSYGYRILDQAPATLNGERVNELKRVTVFEASPVVRAAGISTRTIEAKDEEIRRELEAIRDAQFPADRGEEAKVLVQIERLRFLRNELLHLQRVS